MKIVLLHVLLNFFLGLIPEFRHLCSHFVIFVDHGCVKERIHGQTGKAVTVPAITQINRPSADKIDHFGYFAQRPP